MALIDVAILAALAEEYTAVLQTLRLLGGVRFGVLERDGRQVESFLVPFDGIGGRPSGFYATIVASDFKMGGEKMAQFATDLFRSWKPNVGVLTGIAATTRDTTELGDVAVAEQIFSIGNIAASKGELVFRQAGYQVSGHLRRAAHHVETDLDAYGHWQKQCRSIVTAVVGRLNAVKVSGEKIPIPDGEWTPKIHVKAGAAGPFLIRSKNFRDKVVGRQVDPKVTWVEMESHGFMEAAHERDVHAIVVKGISDDGTESKTQTEKESKGFWRVYAATNAASLVAQMLRRRPFEPLAVNNVTLSPSMDPAYAGRLGVRVSRTGVQNLGFPELLHVFGPITNLRITFRSYDLDATLAVPIKRRAEARQAPGMPEPQLMWSERDGELSLRVLDGLHPFVLGVAMVFSSEIRSMDISVNGEFGAGMESSWP